MDGRAMFLIYGAVLDESLAKRLTPRDEHAVERHRLPEKRPVSVDETQRAMDRRFVTRHLGECRLNVPDLLVNSSDELGPIASSHSQAHVGSKPSTFVDFRDAT